MHAITLFVVVLSLTVLGTTAASQPVPVVWAAGNFGGNIWAISQIVNNGTATQLLSGVPANITTLGFPSWLGTSGDQVLSLQTSDNANVSLLNSISLVDGSVWEAQKTIFRCVSNPLLDHPQVSTLCKVSLRGFSMPVYAGYSYGQYTYLLWQYWSPSALYLTVMSTDDCVEQQTLLVTELTSNIWINNFGFSSRYGSASGAVPSFWFADSNALRIYTLNGSAISQKYFVPWNPSLAQSSGSIVVSYANGATVAYAITAPVSCFLLPYFLSFGLLKKITLSVFRVGQVRQLFAQFIPSISRQATALCKQS